MVGIPPQRAFNIVDAIAQGKSKTQVTNPFLADMFLTKEKLNQEVRSASQLADAMSFNSNSLLGSLFEMQHEYKLNPKAGLKNFKEFIHILQIKILKRIQTLAEMNQGRSKYKRYHIENLSDAERTATYIMDKEGEILVQSVYSGKNRDRVEKLFNNNMNDKSTVEVELSPTGKLFGHLQVSKDGQKVGRVDINDDKLSFELPTQKSKKKK